MTVTPVKTWVDDRSGVDLYYIDGLLVIGTGGLIPLAQLADYARGSIIIGGATEWEDLVIGAASTHLESDGVDIAWQQNLTMADDAWIGIASNDLRVEFDSTDGDIMLGLGDAAGSDEVQVLDSGDNVVASIDSDGNVVIEGDFSLASGKGIIHADSVAAGYVLRADGTRYVPANPATTSPIAPVAQGDMIVANAVPAWSVLTLGAAAGYALISTATTAAWDQTPTWTGLHTFGAGITFSGASGANDVTVPDNVAIAVELLDAGGLEYLRLVTTDAQPIIHFNDGSVDVDFLVEAVGVTDALQVRGADGQITLGVLTAGYVKSNAGGALSAATEVPLVDLGSYTQGDLIYGGAADWQDLAIGGAYDLLGVNVGGTEPEWQTFDWDNHVIAAGGDGVHDHSAAGEGGEVPLASLGSYTQGDLIYGGAADWQDLAIGGIGDFLWVNAAGTEPEWHTLVAGDLPAHNLLSAQHGDTAVQAVSRGSLVYGDATPDWNELTHPGVANRILRTPDVNDVSWSDWSLIGTAGQVYTFSATGGTVPTGTGVANQVTFWGAGSTLLGDAGMIYNAGTNTLTVGAIGVSSGGDVDPADASGQDLGDATHRWDLYTQEVYFGGGTGTNVVTLIDNLANALYVTDDGDADVYLQIVTTTGSEQVIFNAGTDDVDFTVQASGVADALQVRGSDGQITLGVLGAGFVQSTAGGVLSSAAIVGTDLPWTGAANRVAYWSGANTLTSDAGLFVDTANDFYLVADAGGIGNSAATARLGFDSSGATDYAYFLGCNVGIGKASAVTLTHWDFASTALNYTHTTLTGSLFLESNPNTGIGNFGAGIVFGQISGASTANKGASIYSLQSTADADSAGIGIAIHSNTAADPREERMRINNAGVRIHIAGSSVASTDLHIYEDDALETPAFLIEQDGAGDAAMSWLLTGGVQWSAGIDHSIAGDPWILSSAADLTDPHIAITTGGRVAIGGLTAPLAQTHIDQASNTGGIPVLILDQGDISEQCIDYRSDGVDRDINLWTVDVTGTPSLTWDESEDALLYNVTTAATTTQKEILTLEHISSGAAAAEFGSTLLFKLEDGASASRPAAEITALWASPTGPATGLLRIATHYNSATRGYIGTWAGAVDGVVAVAIPGGAGDVTEIFRCGYVVARQGGVAGEVSSGALNGLQPGSGPQLIYNVGGNQVSLTVGALGAVSVQKNAGAGTYDVVLFLIWI